MGSTASLRGLVLGVLCVVAAVAGACGPAAIAAGPYPRLAEFAGREVAEVRFAGDLQIPVDSLRAVTMTRAPVCRIPLLPRVLCPSFAVDRYRFSTIEVARDVARLQLYYRDHGYYGSVVVPDVDPLPRERVSVRFAIVPGDQVILRELTVEGVEEIVDTERLLRQIPLRPEAPFRRIHFLASADTIRGELLRRGYAFAEVLRNYQIDTVADYAAAEYQVIPGPLVRVDSIAVVGANRLGEPTARRMLTFRETDLLRIAELNNSQRNLYGLGMVNFASVEIAPDTLQRTPEEDSTATVLVRVVEAPQHLVDLTAGYGTVDCLRTGLTWTNRNFLGGARRLEVSASASILGVGWPTNMGLERNLCGALSGDRETRTIRQFSDTVNYRLGADFQQPRLFGTQNRLGVGVRAQRISELDAYVRRVIGSQVAVSRDLGPRTLLATTVDIERGATRADPAVFCVAFDVCAPEVQATLQRTRWSNALTTNVVHDRTVTEGVAVRGWAARGGVAWASPAFGSDDEYLRVTGEVLGHRALRPGWVLAARLFGGSFVQGSFDPRGAFIPPDRRFFAGGPNSVRGFGRNALGPVVYVAQREQYELDAAGQPALRPNERPRSSATGGTETTVGSLELRTPSPVFSEVMRLGFFVDGGQVWAPGTTLAAAPIEVTPGIGFRFITPVGPIRVDAAYNFRGIERGPLYRIDDDNNLVFWRLYPDDRDGAGQRVWDRFQIHFAVGNAF